MKREKKNVFALIREATVREYIYIFFYNLFIIYIYDKKSEIECMKYKMEK